MPILKSDNLSLLNRFVCSDGPDNCR